MEPSNPESELESFRQQWREEVSARTKPKRPNEATQSISKSGGSSLLKKTFKSNTGPSRESVDAPHESQSHTFHDLEDKEAYLKLGNEKERAKAEDNTREPLSALEHYEQAVEKEAQGKLGDSVNLYRRAFKVWHPPTMQYESLHQLKLTTVLQ